MPENVAQKSNFPSKSQSTYKIEVDNPILDHSSNLFHKVSKSIYNKFGVQLVNNKVCLKFWRRARVN